MEKRCKTYSASIIQGETTKKAIRPNLNYKIMKITGGDPYSYNTISINSYNGEIHTELFTSPGTYNLHIKNDGHNNSLNFSTYSLMVAPRVITKSLFSNNSLVYYKQHSLSCGAGTVKNYRVKSHKT